MRVLLIEDDGMFGKALTRGLIDNGITVDWTRSGTDGFAALERTEYAAALVDIGLPKMSGLEVLRAVRRAGTKTPILVITAREGSTDVVSGLDLGADDAQYGAAESFDRRDRLLPRHETARST